MLTLLILLVLMGGWGGYGWYGYRSSPNYGDGGLIHLLLVLAIVVICLQALGIHHF